MLRLKLLASLLLFGVVAAAPSELDTFLKAAKKRVERNRRGLDPDSAQLDLEMNAPLRLIENSFETIDGKGDNEINGTKKIEDKNIEYYHKKNKGTVKTIVEEKNQDDNKMENVFYHMSYEKEQSPSETPAVEETTKDTTDQTLGDEEDEETTGAPNADEFTVPVEYLTDATVPSEETSNEDNDQQPQQLNAANNAGWFNSWFKWAGQTPEDNPTAATDADQSDLPDTPHLDQAIVSQQFTILSPFYFGSIGLKSPACPPHRPTQISIYFFSFCV